RCARLRALGDGAGFAEIRQVVPDLRNAILEAFVLRSLAVGKILGRMAAPVGEQEAAAGRHAVAALGQAPARLGARVAGGEGGKVDAAGSDDLLLLEFGQAFAVTEQDFQA